MRALVCLAACLPAPLEADDAWICAFTARCDIGRACLATNWPVRIDPGANLISDQGETPLTRLGPGHYASEAMLVTIRPGGVATLTTHDVPVHSYLGQCEPLR